MSVPYDKRLTTHWYWLEIHADCIIADTVLFLVSLKAPQAGRSGWKVC